MAGSSYSGSGNDQDYREFLQGFLTNKNQFEEVRIDYDQLKQTPDHAVSDEIIAANKFLKDDEILHNTIETFISTLIAKTVINKASKEIEEKMKYNSITSNLVNLFKERIHYTKNGIVVLNSDGDIEKEINSPGQLGLVIFQFLNDAIEAENNSITFLNAPPPKRINDNFFNDLFGR